MPIFVGRKRRHGLLVLQAGGGQSREQDIVAPGALLPVLAYARAQPTGARATADVDVIMELVTAGALAPALTYARAQPAGALATGDI